MGSGSAGPNPYSRQHPVRVVVQVRTLKLPVPEEGRHEFKDFVSVRSGRRVPLRVGDQPYLNGRTESGGDLPKSIQLESVPPRLVTVHGRRAGVRESRELRKREAPFLSSRMRCGVALPKSRS